METESSLGHSDDRRLVAVAEEDVEVVFGRGCDEGGASARTNRTLLEHGNVTVLIHPLSDPPKMKSKVQLDVECADADRVFRVVVVSVSGKVGRGFVVVQGLIDVLVTRVGSFADANAAIPTELRLDARRRAAQQGAHDTVGGISKCSVRERGDSRGEEKLAEGAEAPSW